MRGLLICTPHHIYWSEEIKNNEMGGACSMFGGEESCTHGFICKPVGNRPFGNGLDFQLVHFPQVYRENNIKKITRNWMSS